MQPHPDPGASMRRWAKGRLDVDRLRHQTPDRSKGDQPVSPLAPPTTPASPIVRGRGTKFVDAGPT